MVLSARDKRIITDIEQNLAAEDLWWTWRFAHRLRRLERLERAVLHPVRQVVAFTALITGWLVPLGMAAAYGWPWLFAESVVVGAAILIARPALIRRRHDGLGA
jgi:hypothetical protein